MGQRTEQGQGGTGVSSFARAAPSGAARRGAGRALTRPAPGARAFCARAHGAAARGHTHIGRRRSAHGQDRLRLGVAVDALVHVDVGLLAPRALAGDHGIEQHLFKGLAVLDPGQWWAGRGRGA
jgi:hypothetical protein